MGVTYHTITKDWKLATKALAVRHFPTERHTSENIRLALKEIMSEWEIDCVGIVHDNAANVVKATNVLIDDVDSSQTHYGTNNTCFAHTLQLCLKPALGDQFVSNVIARQRNIAKVFRISGPLWNDLRVEMKKAGKKPLRPKIDMEVRWGSTLTMLQRNLKLRKFYAKVLVNESLKKLIKCSSGKTPFPTDQDWPSVKNLVQCLLPINAATQLFGGQNYVSSSIVYPAIFGIYNNMIVSESDDYPAAQNFKRKVRAEFDRRFNTADASSIIGYKVVMATALDPRFKDLQFLNDTLKDEVYSNLEMAAANTVIDDAPTAQQHVPIPEKKRKSAYATLFGESYQASVEQKRRCAASEIDEYRKMNKLPTEGSNVLQFWKENEESLPRLSKLAKKYLSIPATSVPSERVFSIAGFVLNNRRLSLNPNTAEKLILLHENMSEKKINNENLKCDMTTTDESDFEDEDDEEVAIEVTQHELQQCDSSSDDD